MVTVEVESREKMESQKQNDAETGKRIAIKSEQIESISVSNDTHYIQANDNMRKMIKNISNEDNSYNKKLNLKTINLMKNNEFPKEHNSHVVFTTSNQNIKYDVMLSEKNIENRTNQSIVLYQETMKTTRDLDTNYPGLISDCERTPSRDNDTVFLLIKDKSNTCIRNNTIQWVVENLPCETHRSMLTDFSLKEAGSDKNMDIALFQNFFEITYSTYNHLVDLMKQRIQRAKRNGEKKYFFIQVDTRNFVRYLALQYEQHKMIKDAEHESNLHDLVNPATNPTITDLSAMCKPLNIFLKRVWMDYKTSIWKFNSMSKSILETMASLYNFGILSFSTINVSKRVPSVVTRGWHVKNLTHGYMLALLLRNCNVASLNVMRKFYFVIITSETPNVTLKLNIKFDNSSLITYDAKRFEYYPLNFTQWNVYHEDLSNRKMCLIGKDIRQNDTNLRISESAPSYYDSNSTLINSTTIDNGDESQDIENNIFYSFISDSESIDMKSNNDKSSKGSLVTLISSIDNFSNGHSIFRVRRACGETNLTGNHQDKCISTETSLELSKIWLSKIYNETFTLKTSINIAAFNPSNLLDENIFDRLSFDPYLRTLCDYWMQLLNTDIFCKVFLKQIGVTVFNTLFSSVININYC